MMVRDRWLPHAHPRRLSFLSAAGRRVLQGPGHRQPPWGVPRPGPVRRGSVRPANPERTAGRRREGHGAGRAWLPRVLRTRTSIRTLVPAACLPGDVALWKPGYPRRTLELLLLPAGGIPFRVRDPWRSLLALPGHRVRCYPVKNSSRFRPQFPSLRAPGTEMPPWRRTLHEPLRHPRLRFRTSSSRHPTLRPCFLPGRIPPKTMIHLPDFHGQRPTG